MSETIGLDALEERSTEDIMADMILINRGRVHRLFDLSLSYMEYQQSVVDRAAKALQYGDLEDDIYTMPRHVAPAPDAPDAELRTIVREAVVRWMPVDVAVRDVDGLTNAIIALLPPRIDGVLVPRELARHSIQALEYVAKQCERQKKESTAAADADQLRALLGREGNDD